MRKSLRPTRACVPCQVVMPELEVPDHLLTEAHIEAHRKWYGEQMIVTAIVRSAVAKNSDPTDKVYHP